MSRDRLACLGNGVLIPVVSPAGPDEHMQGERRSPLQQTTEDEFEREDEDDRDSRADLLPFTEP